ncbi:protein root UVB sensitive 5-like isoform X3 [Prosopis cineraria]|uniref:protein root UVB sensitive 5-like isoform X3 n=1 Tax=Prosopis cineraria TaxID=364024 RepID=UPI00240F028A|nr:protein root UVB sensitive 5-like isoform X3 [Prosopis cineraria]
MSHSLQLSFPASTFGSSRNIKRTNPQCLQILCSSGHSNFKDEDDVDNGRVQGVSSKAIWIERYSNGQKIKLASAYNKRLHFTRRLPRQLVLAPSQEPQLLLLLLPLGGRFGNLFDDDPKQWRMYADLIGSAGSIFDLTTQLYPSYFLPLASAGNLTKAVARGLKDPSFRVIQNHFAVSGNLGEVAAKEEVWEVVAQLTGLGLGILILDTPGLVKSYSELSLTWMTIRLVHLWLRYESLSVLQFNTINLKRARMLVKSHVLHSTVPGCVNCNREENILAWENSMKPKIIFGLPLEKMDGVEKSHFMVKTLVKLYANEKYILTVNQQPEDLRFYVSF